MTTQAIETASINSAIRLERLEFGKYCSSLNGPILSGVEHRVLGFSPGFPEALKALCNPRIMGLGRAAERRPAYGTVLRPVHQDGRTFPVIYRVGQRLETGEELNDNEDVRIRPYVLARYLVDVAGHCAPCMMFRAMEPLKGLTRDLAAQLEVVSLPLQCPAELPVITEFLQQATLYAIAGVPFQIEATEGEFFQLVHRLWGALPSILRPLLSAGWNVGPPLLGSLLVSKSSISAPFAGPMYLASRAQWTGPAPEIAALLPGRVYCFYCFNWPELQDDELTATLDEVSGPLPQLPDFSSAVTRTLFRQQGMIHQENALFARWQVWLQGVGPPELPLAVADLVEKLGQEKLLDLFSAEAGGAVRDRRFRLAWECLELNLPCFDIAADKKMLRDIVWLRALLDDQCAPALNTFPQPSPQSKDLPQQALDCWYVHLNHSLTDPDCHWFHVQRLGQQADDCYNDWAVRNCISILFALIATADPKMQTQMAAGLPERAHASAARMLALHEPTSEDDGFAASCTAEERLAFTWLVQQQWQHLGFEQAAVLLKWAELLPSDLFSDPWLRLAARGSLNAAQIREMACALPKAVAPESMGALAMEALRLSSELRESIENSPDIWKPILSLWPNACTSVLMDVPLFFTQDLPLTDSLKLFDLNNVQERISYWFDGNFSQSHWQSIRARAVCGLAASCLNVCNLPSCAAYLCGSIFAGQLPESNIEPSEKEIDLTSTVLRAAQPLGLEKQVQELWLTARKGWQLRLLLEACPMGDLVPSLQQQESLISQRSWLALHLENRGIYPGRITHFGTSAADFHSLSFSGKPSLWKDEFRQTALWAAFYDLPENLRGDLRQALDHYAGGNQAKAAFCCLLHLQACKDQKPLRDVLVAYLLPLLQAVVQSPREDTHQLLAALIKGAKQLAPTRSVVNFGHTTTTIFMEPAITNELHRPGPDRLEVPQWLFPLLWLVISKADLPAILKTLSTPADGNNKKGSTLLSTWQR